MSTNSIDSNFVNADVCKGCLKVENLDEKGNALPDFSQKECKAIKKTDGTKLSVKWRNKNELAELAGKTVLFKFYLSNGDLYAFWISPWQTGESRGYTAGGGPGLNTNGIDCPCEYNF